MDLYAARSGEELVREQSFVFQDRGGEWVALRPELTPSLARMIAARRGELAPPLRWWSFGPFWRYENPQKGRTREFYQWNIDLLGVESSWADAELASIAARFFRSVGLTPTEILLLVNDRRWMDRQLDRFGIPASAHPAVLKVIDRKDKLPHAAWLDGFSQAGLDGPQVDSVLNLLADPEGWQESEDLTAFFQSLEAFEGKGFIRYSPTVVRGLDYYTGTVFEARDPGGKLRAILGGGRYDNLVAAVGGDPLPGVGFAMGDVVLGVLLDSLGVGPTSQAEVDLLVVNFPGVPEHESASLADEIRTTGLRVEWYPQQDRVPRQLKHADRRRIPTVVILGPEELSAGEVTVKDLRDGQQQRIPRAALAQRLEILLRPQPATHS
jgi:histidyl-tRNA synthetase